MTDFWGNFLIGNGYFQGDGCYRSQAMGAGYAYVAKNTWHLGLDAFLGRVNYEGAGSHSIMAIPAGYWQQDQAQLPNVNQKMAWFNFKLGFNWPSARLSLGLVQWVPLDQTQGKPSKSHTTKTPSDRPSMNQITISLQVKF